MSTASSMTCQELVELVTMYLEMTLSQEEQARFEEHLAGCTDCHAYLTEMRETIRLVGTLREDAIRPEARDELLAAFRVWKQGR